MKLMESTFEVFAALFLAVLFIEVSFLRGDLLAQTPFYQGKDDYPHSRHGARGLFGYDG